MFSVDGRERVRQQLLGPAEADPEITAAAYLKCDANPALLQLREIVEPSDGEAALAGTIANSMRFWSSEDSILRQL